MTKLFLQICHAVDLWLLLRVGELMEWFVEWTGVQRVRAERGLLLLYALCYMAYLAKTGGAIWWLTFLPVVSVWAM